MLKLSLFKIWGMPNGFMSNYVPAWRIWPSKSRSVKINEKCNKCLILKKTNLSIQSALLFFRCHTAQRQFRFIIEYTIKAATKVHQYRSVQITLINITLLSVKEYWTSIKCYSFIIDSPVFSVSIKIFKNLQFHVKNDFWEKNFLVENDMNQFF